MHQPVDPLVIPIVAISMPLLLVPMIMILKHRFKRREWEHLERMREMDGRHPHARRAGWVGSGGVAAIGAGVPTVAVLGAFLTSLLRQSPFPEDVPVVAVAWVGAVLISAGGLLTSLALAFLQSRTILRLDSDARDDLERAKPAFDPDTFDVVGTRG